jgi:8-oxo-dGTP pyrophosphatase MutT (NUDIX family)
MQNKSNSASQPLLRKGVDPHANPPRADGKGVNFVGISVVYFCHDGKGNFVMAKRGQNARDEQGMWDIGAGGLEYEDSVEETLRKEIMEEYCAHVLEFEFLGYRDVRREYKGVQNHWVCLDFKVLVNPEQVKIGEPHKFDDIGWFTMSNLPPATELHSQIPLYLKKYQGRLN